MICDIKILPKPIKKQSTNHPNNTTTKYQQMIKFFQFLHTFCYFGYVMSKIALKSTPQLASILEPTWLHFGRVLRAKMEPSWQQIAPKIDLQIDKNYPILDRSWDRFCWTLGPNPPPKRGSRNKHLEVFLALETVLWRRSLQERTCKTHPRATKTIPKSKICKNTKTCKNTNNAQVLPQWSETQR